MKSLFLGALIFVVILGFLIEQNSLEIAMNVTGQIGIGGILIVAF